MFNFPDFPIFQIFKCLNTENNWRTIFWNIEENNKGVLWVPLTKWKIWGLISSTLTFPKTWILRYFDVLSDGMFEIRGLYLCKMWFPSFWLSQFFTIHMEHKKMEVIFMVFSINYTIPYTIPFCDDVHNLLTFNLMPHPTPHPTPLRSVAPPCDFSRH